METKEFIKEFGKYNKIRLTKIILISVILLFITFLFTYNAYRINLGYSLELSWQNGIITALIITIIIVFFFDFLGFYLKIRK